MAGSAMFTIVLSRPTMNRLELQMTRTSRRRRWLSSGSGITRIVIAALQLTIWAEDETQGRVAEILVTAGKAVQREPARTAVNEITADGGLDAGSVK
jgi:hypothetical protein